MAIVKGTTKSGIKFQLDSKIKDDTRLLFLMSMIQKCNLEDTESMLKANEALSDLLILIFGTDENVLAFIADVSAVSIHYPGSGLNLAFHLLESSIYAQNIYKDGGVYCLPTSSGGSNSYATDWDDMQGYVSFLTGNKWTLIH